MACPSPSMESGPRPAWKAPRNTRAPRRRKRPAIGQSGRTSHAVSPKSLRRSLLAWRGELVRKRSLIVCSLIFNTRSGILLEELCQKASSVGTTPVSPQRFLPQKRGAKPKGGTVLGPYARLARSRPRTGATARPQRARREDTRAGVPAAARAAIASRCLEHPATRQIAGA
jgi:hypothetical protein